MSVIYPVLQPPTVIYPNGPSASSGPTWDPVDFTTGVESDPNNYGTASGDAAGRVTLTTAPGGLSAVNTNNLVGTGTSRPLAIDVPVPGDWDPATEDLWLRISPVALGTGSNKRLGVAAGLLHSGLGTNGPGIYESSSGNLSAVLIAASGLGATGGVTAQPDHIDGIMHLIPHNGSWRMPVLVVYETAAPSTVSGFTGAATGATALTTTLANWTLRVLLMHATGGTALVGGEVVTADVYYSRVKRPS